MLTAEAIFERYAPQCKVQKNPVTSEVGLVAPEGKIFQMTGQFYVESQPRSLSDPPPQESLALVIAANQDLYSDILKECAWNKRKAAQQLLDYLNDDCGPPIAPRSFSGKWLVVETEMQRKAAAEKPSPSHSVFVKADIRAWYDSNTYTILEGKDFGGGPHVFRGHEGEVCWNQYQAEGVAPYFKVRLIPFKEPKKELYIPPQRPKNELERPLRGGTSHEHMAFRESISGESFSEADRLELVRAYRRLGMPFADDPLRDLEFARPQIYMPKSLKDKEF